MAEIYTPQEGKFRLVYQDGETWCIVIDANKTTHTVNIVEDFDTEEKRLDRIDELGLEYTPIEEENIEQF